MRTMEKIMKITESGVGERGVSGLLFVSLQGFGRAVEGASWGAVGEWKTKGLMGIEKKGESRGRERGREGALKMNFSVGVSMYRLNVTSYWYRLRCSQRNVEANIDIVMAVVVVTAVFLPDVNGWL
jgi:hypothetical protein